jgi:hypothetical protein
MSKAVKSEFQKVLKLIVDSAENRLSQLPPKEAAAVREKIHRIASDTASLGGKKAAKPARQRARRVSPRSRAKVS